MEAHRRLPDVQFFADWDAGLRHHQRVAGNLLLFEIANMGLIGPNLELVDNVDPADGHFEVAWIAANQREE